MYSIFFRFFAFYTLFFLSAIANASQQDPSTDLPKGLLYTTQKNNNTIIHILTIDPTLYRLELVKGHNQVFGRETVQSMANRKNAIAAINGGFFEIGNSDDGRPSGTLMIDGNLISLQKNKQALLLFSDQKLDIKNSDTLLKVSLGKQEILPEKLNQLVSNKEVVLYNHAFGFTTLTPFDRREIIMNKDGIITSIEEHGDNPIPQLGWILSVPKSLLLSDAKIGEKANINFSIREPERPINISNNQNALMGIPLLVKEGQPITELGKLGSKEFAELPHARTAIGKRKDDTIVMVVVEHTYTQPLGKTPIGQVQSILKEKGYSKKEIETLSISKIMPIIQEHLTIPSSIGINLPDLAKFMVAQGCDYALNLDGGGSSSLFLNGYMMNISTGDKDESLGQKTFRPVSDSIVVIKR